VYSTCVSGLTGEDIDAVCKRAENELGIRVIPVNAPGFVGPKNLGNRIAGEVLLEHVIGTGETPVLTHTDINLIGEYNIAGDLWLVEPLLARAGIRILSKITGDSTFEELTWAHQAKLNVVVCSRALINVAREMERTYGIPFVEVSFFGSTEIAKALRKIAEMLQKAEDRIQKTDGNELKAAVENVIKSEEKKLKEALKPYQHLRGKKAVLYTGGVKSWSFISALRDLGIEIVAVGTKKSTVEDEEKMKEILGPNAPLVEDVTPKNLLRLLKERNADILVAGGRNQYLAIKEGYPFVDVNQERHTPYAGYPGLVNLAEQISNGFRFYRRGECGVRSAECGVKKPEIASPKSAILIDPLKHSPAIGAAMALQGIDRALPIIHGA
jgi:nitrogenase molybdenum-cofactor synthesis protein NifE